MNHEKSKQRVNDSARLVDNNILGLNALYGILCLIKQHDCMSAAHTGGDRKDAFKQFKNNGPCGV